MKFKIIYLIPMVFSTASMAGSLPLPHPDSFKGEWAVFAGDNLCNVNFSTESVPEAAELKLMVDQKNGACNLLEGAVSWRPAPDGISLLDQDGMSLIFFSAEDGVYRSEVSGGIGAVLKRMPSIN